MAAPTTAANPTSTSTSPTTDPSTWASKYRGATVTDLDPPPALSVHPSTPLPTALLTATSREITHLTVLHPETKTLLGYVSVPHIQSLLDSGRVTEDSTVDAAMVRFERRKGEKYVTITGETLLEELEGFFRAKWPGGEDGFAVVTDGGRRWVLGVVTRGDLREFVRRRP